MQRDFIITALYFFLSYRDEAFKTTQQIYKIGLEQHERRQVEIKLFEEAIKGGREEAQRKGIILIDKFLEKRKDIFKRAQFLADELPKDIFEPGVAAPGVDNEKFELELNTINTEFTQLLTTLKKELMEIEIQLYERVEEAISNFEHVIQDLTNEFIEMAQAQFVLLRDAENSFNEILSETVQKHATLLVAISTEGEALPDPLKEVMIRYITLFFFC